MPKRAPETDEIDPVRSRLAGEVAAPVPSRPALAEPTERAGQGKPESRPAKTREPARSAARDRLTVNRKVMFTEDEAERNALTTSIVTAAFGSRVSYSQVTRAMWSILAGAENAVRANARRAPRVSVPSTGDHLAMVEYEEAIAEFLLTALKRS